MKAVLAFTNGTKLTQRAFNSLEEAQETMKAEYTATDNEEGNPSIGRSCHEDHATVMKIDASYFWNIITIPEDNDEDDEDDEDNEDNEANEADEADENEPAIIKNATYVSVWDGCFEVATRCQVNMKTKKIFNIEVSDAVFEADCCTCEKVIIDGIEYLAANKDEMTDETDFWYE